MIKYSVRIRVASFFPWQYRFEPNGFRFSFRQHRLRSGVSSVQAFISRVFLSVSHVFSSNYCRFSTRESKDDGCWNNKVIKRIANLDKKPSLASPVRLSHSIMAVISPFEKYQTFTLLYYQGTAVCLRWSDTGEEKKIKRRQDWNKVMLQRFLLTSSLDHLASSSRINPRKENRESDPDSPYATAGPDFKAYLHDIPSESGCTKNIW